MTKKRTPSFELLLSSSGLKPDELDAPIQTKIEVYHSQREIAAKATGKKALNARRLARSLEAEIETDIQVQIAEGRCDDCVVRTSKQEAPKATGNPAQKPEAKAKTKASPIANDIAILNKLKADGHVCDLRRSALVQMGLKTKLGWRNTTIGPHRLELASAWQLRYHLKPAA